MAERHRTARSMRATGAVSAAATDGSAGSLWFDPPIDDQDRRHQLTRERVVAEALAIIAHDGVRDPTTRTQLHRFFRSLPPDRFPTLVALGEHIWVDNRDERFRAGLQVLVEGWRTHSPWVGRQTPLGCAGFCCHHLGPTRVGLRRIAVHVRHRRTPKRPRASESGRRRQGRRRGPREHRAAVHQSRTPRRDTHRPGARPARGRRPIDRPPGHRANRPGAHEGDR